MELWRGKLEPRGSPLQVSGMVVEMVPLKGGIGSIFHPPEGKDYKWYISGIYWPIGGLYATYHLLGEPQTTIELSNYGYSTNPPPGHVPPQKWQGLMIRAYENPSVYLNKAEN